MISLESEIANFLVRQGIRFDDNRKSGTQMDFVMYLNDIRFHLEAKEKRQHTNTRAWPVMEIPEQYVAIIDELTIRKMLFKSPNCGLVFRNNLTESYFFTSIVDLSLMPRIKANRPMEGGELKGKWILDVRNMHYCRSLDGVLSKIRAYLKYKPDLIRTTECYGRFIGESIPLGGEVRTQEHRRIDYSSTR